MRLSAYAKKIGVSYLTAYKYYQSGIIKGRQLPTGTIFINDNEIKEEKQIIQPNSNKVALYARVSSAENKGNLDSQLTRIREYSIAKGYTIAKEIKEIGSGVNANRRKLLALLKNQDYQIIVVEHKDRLARFGLEIIEELLDQLGKKIEVINQAETEKEDIVQDLVSIITSFSAKIYGRRRAKRNTETIISKLKNYRKDISND